MRKTERQNDRRRGFAACLLLICGLALSGCATSPPDNGWPAVTYRNVVVHQGDTLWSIARSNDISSNTLAAVNGISDPNVIRAGQVLRVPQVAGAPAHVAEHDSAPTYMPAQRIEPVTVSPLPAPQAVSMRTAESSTGTIAFSWPVEGRIISPFGTSRAGERNDGINISATLGEPIHAAAAGIVTYAGNELKGYGNLVLIRHDDGYVTAYAHAERMTVTRGQRVAKGQVIGYAGDTGDVRTPQLHFEIRKGVEPLDPKPLLMASST